MSGPLRAQLGAELRILSRNGEQLLLTIIIPVLVLVFFGIADVLPTSLDDHMDFLTPGVIALAVMSTSMVSLGIATGFERSYQVLKRLGATPLGRPRWLLAKILTVLVVEIVQLAVLVPVAIALDWNTDDASWPLALAAVALGTFAFGGLGLFIAGRLRAEINLAAQNGLYIVLLLLGGMVLPFDELPGFLADASPYLPSGALADVMRDALVSTSTQASTSWIVLGAWALAAPVIAALTFRWE
ncbi:MAG: ABC transporter permease [Actinomycetota bacterium]|nr:ABC transporter permease [Actinomycetota bacterium]MDA2972694.1 ABC transporter permease [Actinomycetota bacterium]MDA3002058.1 ABC transporter permease [Actinomycetota bacterium]